ncbi:MAG: HEAT repeat domain-containing protein [Acidobacteriota bacterium]|nr:HEAT repeat domain-containing protein [Acidobacteriota bacterium]
MRRKVTVQVEAGQVFKTDRPSAREFQLDYTEDVGMNPLPVSFLKPGQVQLLFLKAASPGVYHFADRFMGATWFSVLPGRTGTPGMSGLEAALDTLARRQNKDDRINALRLLQGFEILSPDSLSTVENLAGASDPETAFAALAVLLKTHSPAAVERLAQQVEKYKGGPEPISLSLVSIETELGSVTNEEALPAVEALASSRFLNIRIGAMQSLRKMRNPRAAPVVVNRLDDPNSDVQYLAVITLAETLGKNGDYAPSVYLFRQRPQYYVELWKKWWQQEGKARVR